MSEHDELVAEVQRLPAGAPTSPGELAAHLSGLKRVAGRWADLLLEVSEMSRDFSEDSTVSALELAFRRAEQSYVELEIAHHAVRGGRRR